MFNFVSQNDLNDKVNELAAKISSLEEDIWSVSDRVDASTVVANTTFDRVIYDVDALHQCRICLKPCDSLVFCDDCAAKLRNIFFPNKINIDAFI